MKVECAIGKLCANVMYSFVDEVAKESLIRS